MKTRRFLVLSALACSLALPAMAEDNDVVRVGITNNSSDVGFFIAHKRGYFEKEGLKVKFVPFAAAARMIAPFGSGDLEAGGGGVSAGLFNAVARGIHLRIVADKSTSVPGFGSGAVMVRQDHVDSGRYKSLKDFKGFKIALPAPGTATSASLDKMFATVGLSLKDMEPVYLSFPQMVTALDNKAADAAFMVEPMKSAAEARKLVKRVFGDEDSMPYHQIAVTVFSDKFAKDRKRAVAFMRALLRANRDYQDAITGGKLAGPEGEKIIAILTEYGNIKNPQVYRAIKVHSADANGAINLKSLQEDLDYFKKQGLIKGKIEVADAVDTTIAEEAVKQLGPYKRKQH